MTLRLTLGSIVTCVLVGCAGFSANHDGNAKVAKGDLVSGIARLKQAVDQAPENLEYRRDYFVQREAAINLLSQRADIALTLGALSTAADNYQQILAIDSSNATALSGLDKVASEGRYKKTLDAAEAAAKQPEGVASALSKVRSVLSENPANRRAIALARELEWRIADESGRELGISPKLRESFRKPVTLTLSGANLQQAFDILKLQTGLNFLFDKDVRTDARISISVQNKPIDDVLRLLLASNQLERRVLDDDTVFVYPNTPAKSAEYRELVIRSFYISNADASKTATLIKTLLKTKDVFVDEKLNLIILRDTPEVVRLAAQLIANQDLAEPEVMLDLEVLEVTTSKLTELGIQWPDSLSASVGGAAGAGQFSLSEFHARDSGMVNFQVTDPLVALHLHDDRGNTNLLANPRIRVRNRQTAKVLIGERVPVITTLATANVGTSQSVNYLDVGLKLEIEPGVALDGDVNMKMALEVSSILETIKTSNGTQAYRLGTRNASTTLRVRDGETQVLGGLIQRDERTSKNGVPGLNALPLLSRLFGSTSDSASKTEIVLLVTPHVVRNIDVPGPARIEILSGTETALGAQPIQLGTSSGGSARVQNSSQFPQPQSDAPSFNGEPAIVRPSPPGVAPAPALMPVPMPVPSPVVPVVVPPPQGVQPGGLAPPPLVPTAPGSPAS